MSATDELRRLLDERGVEWRDGDATSTTEWKDESGAEWSAMEWAPTLSVLVVSKRTPAQAVELTLGRERWCRLVDRYGDWYCTNCGEMVGTCDSTSELHVDGNTVEHLWKYCPYCGARVIASVVEL